MKKWKWCCRQGIFYTYLFGLCFDDYSYIEVGCLGVHCSLSHHPFFHHPYTVHIHKQHKVEWSCLREIQLGCKSNHAYSNLHTKTKAESPSQKHDYQMISCFTLTTTWWSFLMQKDLSYKFPVNKHYEI